MSLQYAIQIYDKQRSALAKCKHLFFFFNDTATTEIYTLSLHDALPIFDLERRGYTQCVGRRPRLLVEVRRRGGDEDRKSTRLNSSHLVISYAVFCLKKKITRASTPIIASISQQMRTYLSLTTGDSTYAP